MVPVFHAQQIAQLVLVRYNALIAHLLPIFTTKTVYLHVQMVITAGLLLESVLPARQPCIAPLVRVQLLALAASILTSTIKTFASLLALRGSQYKTQSLTFAILVLQTAPSVADILRQSAPNAVQAIF